MADRPAMSRATIRIMEVRKKASLSLSGPHILAGELALPEATDWDLMKNLAKGMSKSLSLVRDSCPSLTLTPREGDRALEALRSAGTTMLGHLLGKYRSMTERLGPGTLRYGPAERAIMDVEIICVDALVLPAEILPLANPLGAALEAGMHDAAALLGFGAECYRSSSESRARADDGLLDPRAVRFYWHSDLRGAREQWKWLREKFQAKGPHPEKGDDSQALAELVILKERGQRLSPLTAAIEHFHCHHEQGGEKKDVMRLRAARTGFWVLGRDAEIKITADQIMSVGKPALAGLVFLNACSSQILSLGAVSSFARELLLNGRNAVITSWCDVPDDVALKIACFFYEALLRGDTVGASLREARIRLLLERNNPLGLMYTVYGDSQFRLVDAGIQQQGGRMTR